MLIKIFFLYFICRRIYFTTLLHKILNLKVLLQQCYITQIVNSKKKNAILSLGLSWNLRHRTLQMHIPCYWWSGGQVKLASVVLLVGKESILHTHSASNIFVGATENWNILVHWATGPQNIFPAPCDKMIIISIIAMWAVLYKVPFKLAEIIFLYKYM